MGGNICKELGIVPNATIDRHRFYSLWAAYDVEKVGRLLPSTAKKFLREFAASFGTTYSDTLAEQIISRCNKSGNVKPTFPRRSNIYHLRKSGFRMLQG